MVRECVLLIHGLGESELRMLPISLCLNNGSYRTVSITYPSTLYASQHLAEEYIAPVLADLEGEEVLHVVTHSMGGILLRYCLQMRAQKNLKRVVMLSPAHHGSELLEVYRYHPLLAAFYGPALQESGTIKEQCFPCTLKEDLDCDLGIIAGSIPIDPLSLFLLPWPHDGRVSVASTKLRGMKDHIIIPSTHEFITYHPLAVFQTQYFLKHGRFLALDDCLNDNVGEKAQNSDFKVPMNVPV